MSHLPHRNTPQGNTPQGYTPQGLLLTLLLVLCTASPLAVWAQQDEVQYTKEIGMGVGLGFMNSDLNHKWYAQSKPAADVLMRFILSPRMAIKAELGYTGTKGSTAGVRDFYPAVIGQAGQERLQYSMSGTLLQLGALYELHFLPYGWLRNYLGHKRVTPYMQMGLGLTYAHTSGTRQGEATKSNAATLDIPLGIGLKYKIARRLNLGLDWTYHLTLSDRLDGLAAPTGIEGGGFHGMDHYSRTMLTLTYDISPRCPTCNKAD